MKPLGIALTALLSAAILSVSLTGCFGKEEDGGDAAATTTETVATTVADTPTTAAPAFPFTGYVNATTLNVRPTADTSGYSIGGLKFGETVTVTDREGDWYKIAFGSGFGYVSAQYIQNTPPVAVTTAAEDTTTASPDATTAAP